MLKLQRGLFISYIVNKKPRLRDGILPVGGALIMLYRIYCFATDFKAIFLAIVTPNARIEVTNAAIALPQTISAESPEPLTVAMSLSVAITASISMASVIADTIAAKTISDTDESPPRDRTFAIRMQIKTTAAIATVE